MDEILLLNVSDLLHLQQASRNVFNQLPCICLSVRRRRNECTLSSRYPSRASEHVCASAAVAPVLYQLLPSLSFFSKNLTAGGLASVVFLPHECCSSLFHVALAVNTLEFDILLTVYCLALPCVCGYGSLRVAPDDHHSDGKACRHNRWLPG